MSDGQTTDSREIFAAYLCDERTRGYLEAATGSNGFNSAMIFKGGIAAAARALGAMKCPNILIVDISESAEPITDMGALAEVCAEGTIVIAVGAINDVTLYRSLMSAGVQDYLVKPVTTDMFKECLATAQEIMNEVAEEETGPRIIDTRQIVFIGARGGIGTSNISANIAALAAGDKINTALLDLDIYFGTAAMMFDLEPGRGLADALENPTRVDGLFLERAVVKPTPLLSIMASESPFGMMPTPPKGAVSHLINTLGENYDAVVVDAPRGFLADHIGALEAATDVVLVTDLSLVSARDCIRILAQVKNVAPEAEIHIVANRTGPVDEVQQRDFEHSIEEKIDLVILDDRKPVIAAAQRGQLITDTDPSSKLSIGIKTLFTRLMGSKIKEEANTSWFAKLMAKG